MLSLFSRLWSSIASMELKHLGFSICGGGEAGVADSRWDSLSLIIHCARECRGSGGCSGENNSYLWGEKTSLPPGRVDPGFGWVSINDIMFRSAIFRFIRALRDFDVGELDDERAQKRNTKIQDNLSKVLISWSIFVSLTFNLKYGPSESLRLGRTLFMRYVWCFLDVINPKNQFKAAPDLSPTNEDTRLHFSIICDRMEGLEGELRPWLMVFPELSQITEKECTSSSHTSQWTWLPHLTQPIHRKSHR